MQNDRAGMAGGVRKHRQHLDPVPGLAEGGNQPRVEAVLKFQRRAFVAQVRPSSQRGAVTAACRSQPNCT